MADEEDNAAAEVKLQVAATDGSTNEEGKPDGEGQSGNGTTQSPFISTTDSMKNAARTKVDTIISQVRLAVQSKGDYGTHEKDPDDGGSEVVISLSEEEVELKFVDALCDSVSFQHGL